MARWLTVGELKRLLADVADDALVLTEGCDCVGPAGDVSVEIVQEIWNPVALAHVKGLWTQVTIGRHEDATLEEWEQK